MIVKKFGTAVPESGFVLVAFEDEFCSTAKSITLAKILRNTADQKIWTLAPGLENPGEHRGRGSFPVRSADHNPVFGRKKHFFQNFRHRAIWDPPVQYFF